MSAFEGFSNPLTTKGPYFCDATGRTVILRGINLAGISTPKFTNYSEYIQNKTIQMDLKNISWIDRPFPLEECEIHFRRLKNWGFNCIRMLTSWEAIEHEGPYQYDEKYLDYLTELIKQAGNYGFHVFLNFHQDVWSRATGGDGNPLWLFDKISLDYTKFDIADAAITMQHQWDPDPKLNQYQEMSWGLNSRLFPARTMWTLFWGGRDFAPKLNILDEQSGHALNIQDYLQNHFIKAMEQIFTRIKDFPHVIGINPINEPSKGFIGLNVSKRPLKFTTDPMCETGIAEPGIAWSPLDNMFAAAGYACDIEVTGINLLKGLKVKDKQRVNRNQISIWKKDAIDFWRDQSVWTIRKDIPISLNDNYFRIVNDKLVDFTADYLIPFHNIVDRIMHQYNPKWMMFMETDPVFNGSISAHKWPNNIPIMAVDASHWYDLSQLGMKRFFWPLNLDLMFNRVVWGNRGIQAMYTRQIKAS